MFAKSVLQSNCLVGFLKGFSRPQSFPDLTEKMEIKSIAGKPRISTCFFSQLIAQQDSVGSVS